MRGDANNALRSDGQKRYGRRASRPSPPHRILARNNYELRIIVTGL